jgi:hypothetical protein
MDLCVLCDDDSDGLHLSVGGNRIVVDELVNVLNDILFLRADKLPMDFPPFGDIDPKNPGVAFQSWKNNANPVCFLKNTFDSFCVNLNTLYSSSLPTMYYFTL